MTINLQYYKFIYYKVKILFERGKKSKTFVFLFIEPFILNTHV